MRENNIPCLTIHDSIIVPEEYQDMVQNKLSDEIEKVVGFKPKLSINGH